MESHPRFFARASQAPLILLLSLAGLAPAQADVIGLSATSFVPRDPTTLVGEEDQGLLQNAQGSYFAPVVFPQAGTRICRFVMIYRDFDVDANITAKLKRKVIDLTASAFAPPVLMAQVQSAGSNNAVRRATDTTVTDPVVKPGASFYFVELTVPANTLQVLGVQIVYAPSCG